MPEKEIIIIIDNRPTFKITAPDKSIIEHNTKIEWELRNQKRENHRRPYKYHR
jgi:hypothetical protein